MAKIVLALVITALGLMIVGWLAKILVFVILPWIMYAVIFVIVFFVVLGLLQGGEG